MPVVFLEIYLKFAYYLCLSPVRVKRTSGFYSVESSYLRKVSIPIILSSKVKLLVKMFISNVFWFLQILFVSLASLVLLGYLGRGRIVYQEMDWYNPIALFKLFEIFWSIIYKATFLKTLFKNAEVYKQLLNAFHSDLYLYSLQHKYNVSIHP